MVYLLALCIVVLLDTLCVRFIFPRLPHLTSKVNFLQAFLVTFVSAILIGIVLLEIGGGMFLVPFLPKVGLSKGLAYTLVKNIYLTLSPLLCAIALLVWTRLIPSLGFHRMWPDAFLAGLLLDFIDRGIVVPWVFRIAEALAK